MDISSDSSSSDEDTAIEAYWDSNVGFPFTDRVSEGEFRTWSFFFYRYMIVINRVLSISLGNAACLHVKHTHFSANL